ncbi:hypothetical protein [Nocardioides sp. SR21]|uniref:hypothetical protein n=1 Tax=Nocardioides sp. SR21 TaxID=2919501 RepID=UPI001FAA09E0|nr:hypothetical protein [Nocardioides sp. SR21]
MRISYVLGVVLVSLAIGVCMLLGSLGWFAVGFGMMTDCTNNYSCTETGCPPCGTTERWINAGGITQWILAGAGVVVLVLGARSGRAATLIGGGAVLLVVSTLTIVGTTWRASESFCQPGTRGYDTSYCSISS